MPGSVFGKLQKPRSQRNRFGIGQGGQLGGRHTTVKLADKSGQSAGVVACFNFRQNALELSRLFLLHGVVHCLDRKSTRLNSSHVAISYAVLCLKKKIT